MRKLHVFMVRGTRKYKNGKCIVFSGPAVSAGELQAVFFAAYIISVVYYDKIAKM
jgi:hypothetical protein